MNGTEYQAIIYNFSFIHMYRKEERHLSKNRNEKKIHGEAGCWDMNDIFGKNHCFEAKKEDLK